MSHHSKVHLRTYRWRAVRVLSWIHLDVAPRGDNGIPSRRTGLPQFRLEDHHTRIINALRLGSPYMAELPM